MTSYVGLIGGPPGPTWRSRSPRMEQTERLVLERRGFCRGDARFGLCRSSQARRQHIAATFGLSLDSQTLRARTDPLKSGYQAYGVSTVECPMRPPRPGHNVAKGPRSTGPSKDTYEKLRGGLLVSACTRPPATDAKGRPYGLLLVFDGETYGLDEEPLSSPTPVILDNLIASGKIPAVVAVLVCEPGNACPRPGAPQPHRDGTDSRVTQRGGAPEPPVRAVISLGWIQSCG